MKDGLCQWSEFMVQLLKKLVLRALGSSLGINRMWAKKNDHALKSEGVDFFNTCSKRVVLKSLTILFSWASLVFPSY